MMSGKIRHLKCLHEIQNGKTMSLAFKRQFIVLKNCAFSFIEWTAVHFFTFRIPTDNFEGRSKTNSQNYSSMGSKHEVSKSVLPNLLMVAEHLTIKPPLIWN